RAAARAISVWEELEVQISMASISGDSTTSRQSVAANCQPSWPRADSTRARSRPQIVCISTLDLSEKKWGACRQALEWALPMNPYPMRPTRSVLAIFKVGVELGSAAFIVRQHSQVNRRLAKFINTQLGLQKFC